MTEPTDDTVPAGLADLPLSVREARERERLQELNEGMTRRHLANAKYDGAYQAANLARALQASRDLTAKLDKG